MNRDLSLRNAWQHIQIIFNLKFKSVLYFSALVMKLLDIVVLSQNYY